MTSIHATTLALFVNPDLTVHLAREPSGEWVALDAARVFRPAKEIP